MKCLAVLMIAYALTGQAWALNKCTGADGKVVFQDRPCEGQGEKITVRPAAGHGDVSAGTSARESTLKMQRENAMSEAIRLGLPAVGMTVQQLQQAMGQPTTVNADNYQGVMHDQIIYERPDATWYVYTRNGIVQSIQHRPGPPLGMARAPKNAAPCPTPQEIRDAETSASSIALNDRERAERYRMIRDMRACGRYTFWP